MNSVSRCVNCGSMNDLFIDYGPSKKTICQKCVMNEQRFENQCNPTHKATVEITIQRMKDGTCQRWTGGFPFFCASDVLSEQIEAAEKIRRQMYPIFRGETYSLKVEKL